VDPDIALITTIDLDHAAFLGTDRDVIGFEKAGIFRSGAPAVLGSTDLPTTVAARAEELGAPLYSASVSHGVDGSGLWWTEQGDVHRLNESSLSTTVPLDNLVAARQAFALSPFRVSDAQTLAAFNAVRPAGRLQHIEVFGQTWVLDVAHNPHAARYLAQRLGHQRWHILLGMLADKDVEAVAAALAPLADQWSLVSLDVPRGLTAAELKARATVNPAQCYDSVARAIEAATVNSPGLPVLVCGSFFTVAEALNTLAAR
jgi:dihydrofolate synthase/folylpolyglutamate synthase